MRTRQSLIRKAASLGAGTAVEPEEHRASALQAKCHAYLLRAEALRVQTLEMRQTRTRTDMLKQAQRRVERVKQEVSTEAELPPYVAGPWWVTTEPETTDHTLRVRAVRSR